LLWPVPRRQATNGDAFGGIVTEDLAGLEGEAIALVRDAFRLFAPCCVLWSMGKDSTALLWLMRKAFLGTVPVPVVQLDTGMELPEVYAFRDRIAAEWNLDLRVEACPPEESCDPSLPPQARAAARKTEGLRALIAREGFRAVFVGIRRDEQATRAKERLVSPRALDGNWNVREQPPEFWGYTLTEIPHGGHVRVHPLLPWTELDVWRYHKREDIPFVPLYLARDGLRYRSLGEKNITVPVASSAASLDEIIAELATTREPERAGRTMDRESEASFERLRTGGYM
jgi:sulfate adenylyltransferase subunit 2